jgi:hypothetical protein
LAGLGILTIRNVQSLNHNRAAPDASTMVIGSNRGIQSSHSKDRQLVRILLIDIEIYVICTYPQTGLNLYLQITQYHTKDSNQIQAGTSSQYLCSFFSQIPYCFGLYGNLFVSKTFRKEVKKILLCK